ncbi:PKD domain-containing protein [Cytophagaceae bacterium DM2B3-1]|uniref:PKD domain-containing protein n=1 Tax=Xanthocytophaga flava TaxID=3048013 RepID=A0ABT7CE57_9BACT|nr:PKD domain-containing protein [Xanthocytophaga flavus]MDJ1491948.1 PKD domain-containing protein [Xanthocytophaga flavus]
MKLFTSSKLWQLFLVWIIFFFTISASKAQCPQPGFTLPDTVCIGENITITNTSIGATRYEWDFCSGNLKKEPQVTALLQANGSSIPTNITTVFDGVNWFGFFFSRENNTLFRLDFGASLNNTPTLIDVGIFNTPINKPEPIEFVKDGNNWYAFTSNFSLPSNASTSHLIRLDFGASLTNTPSTIDLGNPNNLFLVIRSIRIVANNGNYLAVVTNTGSSTVAIINLGSSVANLISQDNILVTPTFPNNDNRLISTSIIKDCNQWYGITTSETNGKIYRLSFGTNLFSVPQIEELNLSIPLSAPTLSVLAQDQGYFGYVSSELGNIYAFDFGSSMANTPVVKNLGDFSILSNSYGFTLTKTQSDFIGFSLGYNSQLISKIRFVSECSANPVTSILPNPTLTFSKEGMQQITLRAYNTNGDIVSFTDSVFVRPIAHASFSTNNQCVNQSVLFTASDSVTGNKAVSYLWDFGDGQTAKGNPVHHTYSTAKTYNVSLTIKDLCNQTNTTTKSVKIYQTSIADIELPTSACTYQTLQFKDISSTLDDKIVKWEWLFSDNSTSTDQNPFHRFTSSGVQTISLTITGESGCQTNVIKSITLKEGPNVDFSFSHICLNNTTQFIDETRLSTGTSLISRSWDFGDNSTPSTELNPSHTYAQTGTYLVKLTIENNVGCSVTLTKSITIHSLPTASFSTALACTGEETQFTDASIINDGTIQKWEWNFGDVESSTNTSSSSNPTHVFISAGTYQVKLKVTNSFGCTDSLTKSITVITSPIASFTSQSNCNTREVVFSNTSQPPAGGSISSWYWDFGDNSTPSTELNPSHTYAQTGTYSVQLTVTSTSRCTNTLVKTIAAGGVGLSINPDTSVCANTMVTFKADVISVNDPVSIWKWNFGTLGEFSTKQPSVNIPNTLTNLPVILTVTTASGCTSSISRNIPVLPSATTNFTYTTSATNPLIVSFINRSINANEYRWNFGDNTESSETNPIHMYANAGIYKVTLTSTHQSGCESTISENIPLNIYTSNNLTIFPNPITKDQISNTKIGFSLSDKQSVYFEIYGTTGNLIQKAIETNTQINFNTFTLTDVFPGISKISKGMYLLILRYGDTVQVQKFIVQ